MERKTTVLLVSKANAQGIEFRQKLTGIPGYKVSFEENADSAMSVITASQMDCLIFNFEVFGIGQVNLIKGIIEVTRIPQVLVFADSADESVNKDAQKKSGFVYIEKKQLNIEKDLAGMCDRLIKSQEPYFHRESPRHPANQPTSVTLLETGRHYSGRMRDISDKGACLEIPTSLVKIGDKVKITIPLERLNRERVIMADVRWVKGHPGKALVGVKFTKADAIT